MTRRVASANPPAARPTRIAVPGPVFCDLEITSATPRDGRGWVCIGGQRPNSSLDVNPPGKSDASVQSFPVNQ